MSIRSKWCITFAFVAILEVGVGGSGVAEETTPRKIESVVAQSSGIGLAVQTPENLTTNASNEKIELTVTIPKQVQDGADLPLQITLFNGGSSNLHVKESQDNWPQRNCLIKITDEQNRECAQTDLGKRVFGGLVFSGAIIKIKPGERRTWTLNLREALLMSPGEYHLSFRFDAFSYDTLKKYPISTKEIPIKITSSK